MVHDVDLRVRFTIEDVRLSCLHARAFGYNYETVRSWASRLQRHSLTWVGAFIDGELVGFVHACWDGGAHAFLLDTIVDPRHQKCGIGRRLVQSLVAEVRAAGCEWLHVDYEPHLDTFYRAACGFRRTDAGLLDLTN
ncbi:GNAT family N-acetyltransferase [Brevibacterium casei]|nr:GNAT family N-acetyltransferase [Brevibacterium casei]MCT1559186.1 GNAT family N-acetyltransferase [Brevibacterium casei]MCT2207614.1 GNAT family N-acetyltransferase [Brevibacterium casei]